MHSNVFTKTLVSLVLATMILSPLSILPGTAHAQTCPTGSHWDPSVAGGSCVADTAGTPTPAPTTTGDTPNSQKNLGEVVQDLSCTTLKIPTPWTKECMAKITYSIMGFFAVFFGVIARLFEVALQWNVKNFAEYLDPVQGPLQGVYVGWKLIRDLINIVLVFLLLFIGIGTVLQTDKLGSKSLLPKIIMAALLINFSMFFGKVLIDVSNLFSYYTYQEITEMASRFPAKTDPVLEVIVPPTAQVMMGPMNPMALVTIPENLASDLHLFIIKQSIMLTLLFLFLIFAFGAGALMLIIRFGILIVLLMTSPIGFFGGLVPKLGDQAKKWWDTFTGQLLFAPILILFFLIVAKMVNAPSFVSKFQSASQTAGQVIMSPDFAGIFIFYILLIILLVTGLVISKKVAGDIGGGLVGKATGLAGSVAFGGMAWAGANTLGRAGRAMAESGTFNRWAAKGGVGGLVGKGLIQSGTGLSKASFDIRGLGVMKDTGAGKAAKGYESRRKDAAKAEEGYLKKAAGRRPEDARVVASREKVESIKRRYSDLKNAKDRGEIDYDDYISGQRRLDQELAAAKKEQSQAQRSVLFTKAKDVFRGDEEQQARRRVGKATRDIGAEGIRQIEKTRKAIEDRLTTENNGKKPAAKAVSEQLVREFSANEPKYVEYLNSLAALKGAQDAKGDNKKTFLRQFAGEHQKDRVFGYMRDAADKVRKDLNESPDDALLKKIKEAAKEAEGGEAPEAEKKPAAEAPATGGGEPKKT